MPTKHPSIEVELRASTRDKVPARSEACGFSTTSEYLRALIRVDLQERVISEQKEINPRLDSSPEVIHVSMTRTMLGAVNRRCDELGARRQGDYVADLVERDVRGRGVLQTLTEAENRRRRKARGLRRDTPTRPGASRRLGTSASKAGRARLETVLEVLFFAGLLVASFLV